MSLGHQLLDALAEPFVDPASRTVWFAWVAFVVVAVVVEGRRSGRWSLASAFPAHLWRHRSTGLDLQLLVARQLLRALGFGAALVSSHWLATSLVRWLDAWVGQPAVPPMWVVVAFPVVLFVVWDLSRYVVHRLMHQVPALWAFHQVHHSAEVLTPLTFHRVHPVEGVIYGLRGALVTGSLTGLAFWLARGQTADVTVLGVNAAGLLFNSLTGNLRHSHVWLRFPEPMERWLLSPAQHQLHHSAQPGEDRLNYGTWIALWDRWGGSWAPSGEQAPERFGLYGERNHGDDLLSAWLGPVWSLVRRSPGAGAVAAGLLLAAPARSQEDDDDDDTDVDIVVLDDQRVPRVAGSAHVLTEEDLALFEHDDIHQVLASVPGVYSRAEDGFGLRPNLGIRGANSDRSAKLTLLEDGVPAAPAPYAAPAAYYFPMVTRMVSVEVFKGPAAVQTGPQTVGGALNLVTRKVPVDATVASVDLAGGLRNTGKLHGFVGHGTDRVGVLGEVSLLTTTGFKQLDGGGPTGFLRGEGMVKMRVATDPALVTKHAVEMKVGYAGERSNETYLGLSVDDLDTPYRRYAASQLDVMRWQRTQLELSWPVQLGRDVSVRTTAYHHDLQRDWTKVNRFAGGPDLHDLLLTPDVAGQGALYLDILRGEEDTTAADQRIQLGTNDRQLTNYGVQSSLRWRVGSGAVVSRLRAGVRLHADDVQRLHTEDPHAMTGGEMVPTDDPTEVLLQAVTRARALAAYVHEDLQVGPLSLLPGSRVEVIRTERIDAGVEPEPAVTRAVFLPGMGLLLQAHPDVQLFGGVYRGFSPVAPGEPEEVQPETAWNYEAGTRLGQPMGLHAEAVYFQNEYLNLTGQCTVSGGCLGDAIDAQFNGGAVRLQGLEAVAGHRVLLPARLSVPIDASYTHTVGRFLTGFQSAFPQFGDVEPGYLLPYVPRQQGAVRMALEHPRFRLGLGLTGRSGMLDTAAAPDTEPEVPALVLLDAAAHVQITEAWEAYVTGSNLTSRADVVSWRPFGARPTAPLQVMAGVKWVPAG
jgi:Fe(3+) dicitrate transport protein